MANCTEAAKGSLADRDADDDSAVRHAPGYGVDEQMAVTFRRDGGAAAGEVADLASSCFLAATAAASVARASTMVTTCCLHRQLVLPYIAIVHLHHR
jgi:hypothetical protein